ncbi:HD domain-containing protein [Sporomusa termitida]|uniref:TIGR00488: putative HD superfamily hydrolase n=1 Tax=Sporomusa termitida TaxID=2377 RepID=A0A517DRF8_9FIRM|nr:HD domain-containing protein [Sporomusa termitida]QDR79923.1 TIGR00488: putative HD superfamily hydrolase [Sporomusa termitida]
MNEVFSNLIVKLHFTGKIETDAINLLQEYDCGNIADHSRKVAAEARRLAGRCGANEQQAVIAGYLHDIGGIIPDAEKIAACNKLGIDILAAEHLVPALLHGKISRLMAAEIFNIKDPAILSAIECHSTLKANATLADMILFVADKLQWDPAHNAGFITDIKAALEVSVAAGAFAYLRYLYDNRQQLKAYHPWAFEAYRDLQGK